MNKKTPANKKTNKPIKVKKNKFAIYDPEKQNGFKFSILIGYFLRLFTLGFSIFGVLWLLCDAFLIKINPVLLLILCVFMTIAFSLIFLGKLRSAVGVSFLLIYTAVISLLYKNPIAYFISGLSTVQKYVVERLVDRKFKATEIIPFPKTDFFVIEQSDTVLLFAGISAIAILLCVVFSAFSAHRTRILPMLLLGGAICSVCFIYNLCNTNWGIAFTLAGLCATVILSCYDKTYAKVSKSDKGRAYSGYSSALAGLLAILILIVPVTQITTTFPKISYVSDRMDYWRGYITTILTGGNPKNNKMNTLFDNVSAKIDEIEFTDDILFEVNSDSNLNVYMRSWIADEYNISGDLWYSTDDDDYAELYSQLGKYRPENFTGDDVSYNLRYLFNEALNNLSEASVKGVGYTSSLVDIDYVENSGNLLVIPSTYVKPAGLFRYRDPSSSYNSYSIYSDGMYRTSWYNVYKQYSSYALLPDYTSARYAALAENQCRFYLLLSDFLTEKYNTYIRQNVIEENIKQDLINEFNQLIHENGLTLDGKVILSDFLQLDYNQRINWYRKYITQIAAYSDYVKSVYTQSPESIGAESVYLQLKPQLDKAETTHDKVMAVINYLCLNYNYSTSPKTPSGEYSSDIDSFLLETKEGYCVQFATAAALILRRAGISSRYVQGYLASNFKKTDNGYASTVNSQNAHAWIEVYIDGLGWCTYETTLQYYKSLYYVETKPDESGVSIGELIEQTNNNNNNKPTPPVTTAPETTAVTAPETSGEDNTESSVDIETVLTALGIALLCGIIILLIILKANKARRVYYNRSEYIEKAIYGPFDDKDELNKVSQLICDLITDINKIVGYKPRKYELPSQFAYRIDNPKPTNKNSILKRQRLRKRLPMTMSEVIEFIQSQEFGHGLTQEQLSSLGEYLKSLIKIEYKQMNIFRRFWFRVILMRI